MDKEDVVPIFSGILLLSHKKNEIMPLAVTWMDLEIIILSEVSQKEKDKLPYDITYMWNLKYDTNELIYETETDLWLPRGRGSGGGMDWEFGISRCKLLYITESLCCTPETNTTW